MSDQIAVRVVFPDGKAQTWSTGTQVIVADGVEPLSATMLGRITGMWTAAGILVPRDDEAMSFDSMIPRDALTAALASTIAFMEAQQPNVDGSE